MGERPAQRTIVLLVVVLILRLGILSLLRRDLSILIVLIVVLLVGSLDLGCWEWVQEPVSWRVVAEERKKNLL